MPIAAFGIAGKRCAPGQMAGRAALDAFFMLKGDVGIGLWDVV